MTNSGEDYTFHTFAIIFGIAFLALVLGALGRFLLKFYRELNILNKEIACTSGPDRRYWLQQRKSCGGR